MARYAFHTTWRLRAPIAAVWAEIERPEGWPEWWSAVRDVTRLERGDDDGVGAVYRYTWRGALPYSLTFEMRTTEVDRQRLLRGEASGQLAGIGTWRLEQDAEHTILGYEWRVEVTKPWMRALSPVARPLFRWNHDVVMRSGERGLAARLQHGAGAPRNTPRDRR